MQSKLNGVVQLAHLAVIRAEGIDAASFLHGQLTQDMLLLGSSEARLAAYCSAQGRMLASFYAIKRSPTEIVLICSKDLLAATLKNLSRFVLRAKVKLSDASADHAIFGLAGAALDVFTQQPLPVDSPLYGMENVLLSPHMAGVTDDSLRAMGGSVARQARQILGGQLPDHLVNHELASQVQQHLARRLGKS